MILPHNSVVLVADGRKSLFFRNEGDAAQIDLQLITGQEHPNPRDGDQKRDRGGHKTASDGIGGDSTGETDFHQLEEDRFAADTAEDLRERVLAGDVQRLVIIAPPRTLGQIRKHIHKDVESRITAEISKDLTGHPVDQIEKMLQSA